MEGVSSKFNTTSSTSADFHASPMSAIMSVGASSIMDGDTVLRSSFSEHINGSIWSMGIVASTTMESMDGFI